MEQLSTVLECALCYTNYEKTFHYPLILTCGHNICSRSVDKLFKDGQVKCPFCNKINQYDNIDGISKNYTFIMLIDSLKHKTILSIEHDQQDIQIQPLEELQASIKKETELIEEHFEKVKAFKDRIVKQNKEIMSAIDVFNW